MTSQRLALLLVPVLHVDDEGRGNRVVDEPVDSPRRSPWFPACVIPRSPALNTASVSSATRGIVIGVSIRPGRQRDRARPRIAYQMGGGAEVIGVVADGAIGPPEIRSPRGAERRARLLGFGQPLVDGPVAAHLACRQTAQPDVMTERRVFRDRPAETDLKIVGMWTEDEKINVASVFLP